MATDEKKGVYGNAEDLATKDRDTVGGEDSMYSNAEELGKKNAENQHEFMAGDEGEKE